MRWIGSLVAETFRILMRGGVFLYPADARRGYGEGRLRLVYEAHPIALIVERAGGAASTRTRSHSRPCDAKSPHQRTPVDHGLIARSASNGSTCCITGPAFVREQRRAAICATRPVSSEGRPGDVPIEHPIISVTGSSGAGTTSVKQTFEQIFRRERIRRPISRATRSIATTGPKCATRWRRRRNAAISTSAISAPKPICSRSSRRRFASTARGYRTDAPLRP